jgi:hypothetical protein
MITFYDNDKTNFLYERQWLAKVHMALCLWGCSILLSNPLGGNAKASSTQWVNASP